MIPYQIIRSTRRKTIGLQVRNGQVTVRAPQGVADSYIDRLIQNKADWLKSKVEQQQSVPQPVEKFVDGGEVYLWGVTTKIEVRLGRKKSLSHQDQLLIITLPARLYHEHSLRTKAIKQELEHYYKQLAEHYLRENLANFIAITGFKPKHYQVRKYKARWGSCNSRQELSFNYLLAMAPPEIFDYVIIHELCHLKHLNHSKSFWQLVARFYPNYVAAKQWFKNHQQHLHWQ